MLVGGYNLANVSSFFCLIFQIQVLVTTFYVFLWVPGGVSTSRMSLGSPGKSSNTLRT